MRGHRRDHKAHTHDDQNPNPQPPTPFQAGEAIGAITKLTHKDGRSMTINVEYNQLDPLLRATAAFAGGDTNDPSTGFSPFPG